MEMTGIVRAMFQVHRRVLDFHDGRFRVHRSRPADHDAALQLRGQTTAVTARQVGRKPLLVGDCYFHRRS